MTVNEAITALEALRDRCDAGEMLVVVSHTDTVLVLGVPFTDLQVFGPPIYIEGHDKPVVLVR